MREYQFPALVVLAFVAAAATQVARAQPITGSCAPGTAAAQLDVNGVRATLYNTGVLFYPAAPGYEVPKGEDTHGIFAASLWVGGLVNDELRVAAATYPTQDGDGVEFFPGPLNQDGSLPDPFDCAAYDAMYRVSRADLQAYEQSGTATPDLLSWPYHLGAPVEDGDGIPDNYDLAAGDRPQVLGDQTVWWVMNDVGGPHVTTASEPIGLEVQVTAYAFATDDAANDATIYRYRLIYRGSEPVLGLHVGFYVDPDLGNFADDFVGVDTLRDIAYVYNGDDLDEGAGGYGQPPPALGFDLFQGLRADADGIDNDGDGTVDEAGERLGLTSFIAPSKDGGTYGEAREADHFYNYLRGRWTDDSPLTMGGEGFGGSEETTFMFPGMPPDFWSEEDLDGAGNRRFPGDRRFVFATGPVDMVPGSEQEIAFGIAWARGASRHGSIVAMQHAANLVQERAGFGADDPVVQGSPPSQAPELVTPIDAIMGQPTNPRLVWHRVPEAADYRAEITRTLPFTSPERSRFEADTTLTIELGADSTYYWRVRARNVWGDGPWSETGTFSTSDIAIPPPTSPGFGENGAGIVEVANPEAPNGDPCTTNADGCATYGGATVFKRINSSGEYYVSTYSGSYDALLRYAHLAIPRDFELRFTDEGGYGVYAFESDVIATVPFELWDIGVDSPEDPSDDVRMIPFLLTSDGSTRAEWGYATGNDRGFPYRISDAIYFMDPQDAEGYADFARVAEDAGGPGFLYQPENDGSEQGYYVEFHGDFAYPIGRVVIGHVAGPVEPPPAGTVIRFVTTGVPPPLTPIASAPADGVVVDAPVALWWQATTSDSVDVQVLTEGGIVVDEAGDVGLPPYHPKGLESGQTYYWRLRARNSSGESAWSEPLAFMAGEGVAVVPESQLPDRLALRQNYPNPFRGTSTVRFGLPEAASVRLDVFDVLGRRVAVVTDGTRPAGWHEETIDASGWASGVYFLRLTSGGAVQTRALTVAR